MKSGTILHNLAKTGARHVRIKNGGVGERLKPAVLKTVRPERVSGVQIPPPPPHWHTHRALEFAYDRIVFRLLLRHSWTSRASHFAAFPSRIAKPSHVFFPHHRHSGGRLGVH